MGKLAFAQTGFMMSPAINALTPIQLEGISATSDTLHTSKGAQSKHQVVRTSQYLAASV